MDNEEVTTRFGAPAAPPRIPTEPEFLSRGDVARLFGVSLSTVTRWARAGQLEALRTPGGHYRYRAEGLRRMARSSAVITKVE